MLRTSNYHQFLYLALTIGLALALTTSRWFSSKSKPLLPPSLWLIIAGGFLIRLPLMAQGFWFDEAFTSAIVQVESLADFITAIRGDVHPPGYYFIIYVLTHIFGHSDIVMRLPALLAGTGLIPALYFIGRLHHGEMVGRWSALLVAVTPAAMYYSSEARYPALMALLLALSYIAIRQRRSHLFSLALAGAALLHVNAWFYVVAAGGVWLLQTRRWQPLILPALAILIWFPFALEQAGDVVDGFWLLQMPPMAHVLEMTTNIRFESIDLLFFSMVVVTAIMALAVWHWRRFDLVWLAFVAAIPLAQWLVGWLWNPVYLPRTLLLPALLLAVPVAWWLSHTPVRWLARAGAVALLVAIVSLYQHDRPYHADEAVSLCDGYPVVYATNTKTAILARHFSDAQIYAYTGGNSTDQYLPDKSRRVLFDQLDMLFTRYPDTCIIGKVSIYNTAEEMGHLNQLAALYPDHEIVEQGDYYFVVMK